MRSGSPPPPRALRKQRGCDPLPGLPSPSFLPSSPLCRPRPVHLLPPHVTRQRAMQITAAAGSHWPRRAHLMAARARRMAAGPRAPPAPRAPPLRAHGPGQAAGSPYRARPPALWPSPRACAPSAAPGPPPRRRRDRPPPAPLRSPPRRLAPPGHLGPAHAQRTRRAALLEVAAPELEAAAEDRALEKGGSAAAGEEEAAASPRPGPAHRSHPAKWSCNLATTAPVCTTPPKATRLRRR